MINVKVKCGKEEWKVVMCKGKTLQEMLQENNIKIHNTCHGNGTCGKCKIKVLSGRLPITDADKRMLSQAELERGIRLACKVKLGEVQKIDRKSTKCVDEQEELWIEIVGETEENIIVQEFSCQENKQVNYVEETEKNAPFFIGIDIGTTTIAMALVNEKTGEIYDTYTSLNHQRKFGADVISRIVSAGSGKAEELKKLIEQDLWDGICKLAQVGRKISRIIIAGNTTMIHLLMGYSCETLGKYPFISEHLETIECTFKECIMSGADKNVMPGKEGKKGSEKYNIIIEDNLCQRLLETPVTIFPAISAFVGGDIVAGILACPGFETEEICLYLDLGTNGEMVLGNKDKLLVTSTAAGPAFEGGNIIHGTASIPGSIEKVKIQNQRAIIKTIKNEMPPVGICGTGLVSVIAQLKRNKLMDEQGNLRYPYNEQGFPLWSQSNQESIKIYQKDIREFQMAKSALRSGIEILKLKYGCQVEEIRQVYLAGGFGTNLSVDDIIDIGILPKELEDKMIFVGNGALRGAVLAGMSKMEAFIKNVKSKTENVSLAEHESFSKMYLKYLEL